MKPVIKEVIFLAISALLILPTPTLLWAYVTGKTVWQVLYR